MGSNIHLNGGIQQAFLEIADQDGLLSEADKERLKYLKTLPQDRAEIDGQIIATCEIKTNLIIK